MDSVPVCNVGRGIYYGNELEAQAVRLRRGQKILVEGKERTVECVWFYDNPIVDLVDGGSVIPAFGQRFEVIK